MISSLNAGLIKASCTAKKKMYQLYAVDKCLENYIHNTVPVLFLSHTHPAFVRQCNVITVNKMLLFY